MDETEEDENHGGFCGSVRFYAWRCCAAKELCPFNNGLM